MSLCMFSVPLRLKPQDLFLPPFCQLKVPTIALRGENSPALQVRLSTRKESRSI